MTAEDRRPFRDSGTGQLVSIGIPTYNRSHSLERSVRSALAQDYGNVEVVVADDASTDDSWQVLRRLADADGRLRILRHEHNVGHALNFRHVFEQSRGTWFMWLSDDDWLDPNYVSTCVAALEQDPSAALVAGAVAYEGDGGESMLERPAALNASSAAHRVLDYFLQVNSNGSLFGLASRKSLLSLPSPFEDTLGGDWILVAQLAAIGSVVTEPNTTLHRSPSGISSDPRSFAQVEFGLTERSARYHHAPLALDIFRRISAGEGAFRLIGTQPVRVFVAGASALSIVVRFVALPPALAALRASGAGGLLGWLTDRIQARRSAIRKRTSNDSGHR